MVSECVKHPLLPPKVVAIAQDTYLTPTKPFPDTVNLPGVAAPKYGQDITSEPMCRMAPNNMSVGSSEGELIPKMQKLLDVFAEGDDTGMASRLFNKFLQKQSEVIYFDDPSLNKVAAKHENIEFFCSAALSAPNSPHISPGKIRIHQALKRVNWNIKQLTIPSDLGVPAFNEGSKILATGDFNNGLGLMINGVQYAYVVATHYHYNKQQAKYCITLKFIFYDVFGLDDDDLVEFGAESEGMFVSNAAIGITAWWQLQHQYGYHPLVTRIIFSKTYEVPAL